MGLFHFPAHRPQRPQRLYIVHIAFALRSQHTHITIAANPHHDRSKPTPLWHYDRTEGGVLSQKFRRESGFSMPDRCGRCGRWGRFPAGTPWYCTVPRFRRLGLSSGALGGATAWGSNEQVLQVSSARPQAGASRQIAQLCRSSMQPLNTRRNVHIFYL